MVNYNNNAVVEKCYIKDWTVLDKREGNSYLSRISIRKMIIIELSNRDG